MQKELFVKKEDEFTVNLAVGVDENGSIFCDLGAESLRQSLEGITNVETCDIQEYQAVFKKPSFGDSMHLYDEVFSVAESNIIAMNPILARYKKIALLIKKWNLTESGQFLKPTDEDIRSLHPVIANAIGVQIDSEVGGLLG